MLVLPTLVRAKLNDGGRKPLTSITLAIEGVRDEDIARSIRYHALRNLPGVHRGLGAPAGRNFHHAAVGDGIRDEDIARCIRPHAFRRSYPDGRHRRLNATGCDFHHPVAIGIRDEDISRRIHCQSKRSAESAVGHRGLHAARRQLHHLSIPESAMKRSPAPSTATPYGELKPVAGTVDWTPAGRNLHHPGVVDYPR